jgi:hypothetical protein
MDLCTVLSTATLTCTEALRVQIHRRHIVSPLARTDSYLPVTTLKSGAMTSETARVPVNDFFILLPLYFGKPTESAADHLKIFNHYNVLRNKPAQFFALLLR